MEIKVFVKAWLTKQPNDPMPMRTMVGKVLKETNKAFLLSLHGQPEPSTTCLHCGRKLTHPVSLLYGIGPICMGHMHMNPFDTKEELMEHYEKLRSDMKEIKWKGWIPKSQIIKYELKELPKNIEVKFYHDGKHYKTITDEDKLEKIMSEADHVISVVYLEKQKIS